MHCSLASVLIVAPQERQIVVASGLVRRPSAVRTMPVTILYVLVPVRGLIVTVSVLMMDGVIAPVSASVVTVMVWCCDSMTWSLIQGLRCLFSLDGGA